MTSHQLRAAVRHGDPVYGTLIVSDSPRWPAQIAQIGLDFVFIDTNTSRWTARNIRLQGSS